jgi:hypothetical protein
MITDDHTECSQDDLIRVKVFATRGQYQCEGRCPRKVLWTIPKDSDKVRRNGDENQSFRMKGDECQ